jgi:hypothetical protein
MVSPSEWGILLGCIIPGINSKKKSKNALHLLSGMNNYHSFLTKE